MQTINRIYSKKIGTFEQTDNVTALVTDNVTALVTDNVTALVTDNVTALVTDNVTALVTEKGSRGACDGFFFRLFFCVVQWNQFVGKYNLFYDIIIVCR